MTGVKVRGLSVSFGGVTRVDNVDLDVASGEVLAIVGESGAGKSLIVSALLGLTPSAATVTVDELTLDDTCMREANEKKWRAVRGVRVGLVAQDALSSLDPLRRIGSEVAEALDVHKIGTRKSRHERVRQSLNAARMPDVDVRLRQYPHELSGGLRQRALIASALSADPAILLTDEPTTALDATVQKHILALLRELADGARAIIFVSHDLAAVAQIADRIMVMRHGRVVETGTTQEILESPREPYTRELITASSLTRIPTSTADGDEVLRADAVTVRFGTTVAVNDASVRVTRGRTLGIVGESGSGKSTLANVIMGSLVPTSGAITLCGEPWSPLPEQERRGRRTQIQLVAQNPRASLNPRWTIRKTLVEALRVAGVAATDDAVHALLDDVELDRSVATRRPRQLSGGQAQRVAIARAFAVAPEVLVLDEPLSALDVSVQARILGLLARLQSERGVTIVFISHDLRVVAALAHDLVVMKDGIIIEAGPTGAVYDNPQHEFTRELLAASSLQPSRQRDAGSVSA